MIYFYNSIVFLTFVKSDIIMKLKSRYHSKVLGKVAVIESCLHLPDLNSLWCFDCISSQVAAVAIFTCWWYRFGYWWGWSCCCSYFGSDLTWVLSHIFQVVDQDASRMMWRLHRNILLHCHHLLWYSWMRLSTMLSLRSMPTLKHYRESKCSCIEWLAVQQHQHTSSYYWLFCWTSWVSFGILRCSFSRNVQGPLCRWSFQWIKR